MVSRKRRSDPDESTDDEYRKKRDRNNQAVKRSRVKSKQKTEETQSRVDNLRMSNRAMEDSIEKHKKELKFLKDLFLAQAQSKAQSISTQDLKELLKSDDEDEDNGGASTSKA